MVELIEVVPDREQRKAFAGWAVAQEPKVRTVSPSSFGVPPHLFAGIPEGLLVGAVVDGHRYVSPLEDAANGRERPYGGEPAAPPVGELTGVAVLDVFDEPADGGGPVGENVTVGGVGYGCLDCGRPFRSERGLMTHRRQVHREG